MQKVISTPTSNQERQKDILRQQTLASTMAVVEGAAAEDMVAAAVELGAVVIDGSAVDGAAVSDDTAEDGVLEAASEVGSGTAEIDSEVEG